MGGFLGSDHTPGRGLLSPRGCDQLLFGSLEGDEAKGWSLPHTLAALVLGAGGAGAWGRGHGW